MDRRTFFVTGAVGTVGFSEATFGSDRPNQHDMQTGRADLFKQHVETQDYRSMFPRCKIECFLNAAGGIPQSNFAEQAAREHSDFWRLGPSGGRLELFRKRIASCRKRFAKLIGAVSEEIAFVQNTKSGEQIVIDSINSIRSGGNIVTNDLHFGGSLHNLIGLKKSGVDVRIVRAKNWQTDLKAMKKQIDRRTALVCITLVSNVNGHIEPIKELSAHAHKMGAKVYADIIQAAGIYPFNVRELGIDFASCSGYKWLFGTHGAGFFYVAKELQGKTLKDRVFPGYAKMLYEPWTQLSDQTEDFDYHPPQDATRYQPGHLSYYGFYILDAGLEFIEKIGVKKLNAHACSLVKRLVAKTNPKKAKLISPHVDQMPIATFLVDNTAGLKDQFEKEKIVVAGASNRIRISPAIYNNEDDIDRVVKVLNR